ncbi:DNA-methyltransferase [Methanospirillum lacunae]|uniref:Type II methyltransferase n=1 Tax=Methanospirillum lacunae TaxID=668570 RepID=A0A2V2N5I6_9EURY|nr:site-specific DNA-methyltransferase [Methanospirillum lacunae]PWR71477.1 site-specific DNA-methyltransferase [Methanospirillum lacunae]
MMSICTLYNESCITGARKHLEENSVDLIITDPPYGIKGDTLHKHYNRNESCVVDGYVEIPEEEYGQFSIEWIKEAERILKPGSSIYIVSGYSNLYHILHALRHTSLIEINHIVWKYNFGVWTSRKYISSHYHILFYEKPGGRRTFNLESRFGAEEKSLEGGSLNYQDREDVWVINREYKPGQIKNKNELPVQLLTKMILYSSNEGDLVCDLFLGGGSTARTAVGLNRRAVGFEISPSIYSVRVPELMNLTPGFLLNEQRIPECSAPKRQRERWTSESRSDLLQRYKDLKGEGLKKGEIVERLMEDLGRGKWAIIKALKALEQDI